MIRTVAAGLLLGGLASPPVALGVVSREQHVRNPHPPELARTGVGGVVQVTVLERLPLERLLLAHDARDQAGNRLEDDECRDLASRQHVVADGDLFGRETLDDAFVDALVPAADQHQPGLLRQVTDEGLVQPAPGRRQHDHALGSLSQRFHRGEHRLGLQHHARSAAVGFVVHLAMPVGGEIADVVDPHVDDAGPDGLAQQALAQRALDDGGEDGEHVDPHTRRLAAPDQAAGRGWAGARSATSMAIGCGYPAGASKHHASPFGPATVPHQLASGTVRPGTSRTTMRLPAVSTATITSFRAGISVSRSSDTALHTSFAAVWMTSRTVPSDRPDSVTTSQPTSW